MTIEDFLDSKGKYYVKRPIPIKVVQMPKDFVIKTLHGKAKGKAGDYVARTQRGDIYPIAQDIFDESYKLIGEEEIRHYEQTYKNNE